MGGENLIISPIFSNSLNIINTLAALRTQVEERLTFIIKFFKPISSAFTIALQS